jgi:hypothetical protein
VKALDKSAWAIALAFRVAAVLIAFTGCGYAVDRLLGSTSPLLTGLGAGLAILVASVLVARVFTRRFEKLAPLKEPDE